MGKALYRTYRSHSFDEVIGQDHITQTLRNSLHSGTISHAYLLTGPRGVGKTSVARILAYAVNGIPYDESGSHMDIIEIDAASNRRIEEVRALRDKVHITPTTAKYKVYIIDEVHMLTKEAFNALLKTLEEPPQHVIFILATTEIHKLPETIVSRCVRFSFRPIDVTLIRKHLTNIARQEKIAISSEAISLIANHSGGSFRDSISLLDQAKNIGEKIEVGDIEAMFGLAPTELANAIVEACVGNEIEILSLLLRQAEDTGVNSVILSSQLSAIIRGKIVSDIKLSEKADYLQLLEELLSVSYANNASLKLEIVLMKSCLKRSESEHPIINAVNEKPKLPDENLSSNESETTVAEQSKKSPDNTSKQTSASKQAQVTLTVWDSVLEQLKANHNTLYGVARMAKAEQDDKTLILTFGFPFHYKRMDDSKNKTIVTTMLADLGHDIDEIQVKLGSKEPGKPSVVTSSPAENESSEQFTAITNIFGPSEMLES